MVLHKAHDPALERRQFARTDVEVEVFDTLIGTLASSRMTMLRLSRVFSLPVSRPIRENATAP